MMQWQLRPQIPTVTGDGALVRLCGDQLNNDFEHQYFEDAVRNLGAELHRTSRR
jgi:hypothetical protein